MMTKPLPIDATPQKRLFLSIIADYDFKTSLCELVDNALDHWNSSDRLSPLKIQVFMNQDRQQATVKDTAGGVPRDQIQLLIAPGREKLKLQSVASLIGDGLNLIQFFAD
mgnify:CR=1 FL=1